jgi:hypothetical protein
MVNKVCICWTEELWCHWWNSGPKFAWPNTVWPTVWNPVDCCRKETSQNDRGHLWNKYKTWLPEETRIVFFGAIGNEVAMKLHEPELIYRLLRNKDSPKYKNRIATHSRTCQTPDSTIKQPLLLTGSLVLLLDFFELANSFPQLKVCLSILVC